MLGDLMGIKKTTTPSRSPSPSPTPIEPPEISLKRNSTHNVKKNVLKIDTPSIEPIAEEPIHVEPEVEEEPEFAQEIMSGAILGQFIEQRIRKLCQEYTKNLVESQV
jgi:hypothetical protein